MTERRPELDVRDAARDAVRDDLAELDACLAQVPVPAGLEARIAAATSVRAGDAGPTRGSLGVVFAFAAGVGLTVLVLRTWADNAAVRVDEVAIEAPAKPPTPTPTPMQPEPELERALELAPGLSLSSVDCDWSTAADGLIRLPAGCRLRLADPGMNLEVWATAWIARTDAGVSVHEGDVMFVVEHVDDPLTPAQVGVSGGIIEVLGTRFAVSQGRDGGHVDLIDGAIQFRRVDGILDAVAAGQRYRWRNSADSAPADPPDHQRPSVTDPEAPASTRLADGLAEVARLRRAGDLTGAIAKLDELVGGQSDRRTLEVISYERGTLVERSGSSASACEFWAGHRQTFEDGRYDAEIERRMAQLDCPSGAGG